MEEKDIVRELSIPIHQAKGWLKLLGIVSIIYGILLIIPIVTIIICWLPIWLGVILFRAGNQIDYAYSSGDKHSLINSLNNIKTYFIINGVLLLLGLIGIGLVILFVGGTILTLLGQ